MAKYRVLRQMFDSKTGQLRQPGEIVELELSDKDIQAAIDHEVLEPVAEQKKSSKVKL